jgi:hypothetical protein
MNVILNLKPRYKFRTDELRTSRLAAHNSTLAIGGVPSPLDSFVVAESSVLRTNFCAKKPAHRQSAKRYKQFFKKSQNSTHRQFICICHK